MAKFNVGSSIWVNKKEKTFLGKGRIELLKLVNETGSLSKAAKVMKMSYKAAWDSLNDMNKVSVTPLVESSTGGKGGGGSKLTPMAHLYIELYEKIFKEQRDFFDSIEEHMGDYEALMHFLTRTSLRVSARNQIKGTIDAISTKGLNSHIKLNIGEESALNILITSKSVNELGLKKGGLAYAIIKSSWIKILNANIEGENIFDVKLKDIIENAHTFEYILELKNRLTIVTSLKQEDATYKKGDTVRIAIDPKEIIIGV